MSTQAFRGCPFCGCRIGGSDIHFVGADGDEVPTIRQADLVIVLCACGASLQREAAELTDDGTDWDKWRSRMTEAWNTREEC